MSKPWEELSARRSGWFWLAGSMRNGDTYCACSLASAFAEAHGRRDNIYLVVFNEAQAKVAALFSDKFAEIISAPPGLPATIEGWQPFFERTKAPRFARNVPILLHPQAYEWGRFALELAYAARLTWMDLYKRILHLPGDVEPAIPQASQTRRDRARQLCEAANMPRGRAVVLFPYAQSMPVAAALHFARLTRDLRDQGLTVFTSVARGEIPIETTDPVFIPFDLLIEVVEHAGWVVATRSGICDITSSARCRKTFIYADMIDVVCWSVRAMGFARDADEVVFNFATGTPAHFSSLVRSRENLAPLAAPARRLTPLLSTSHPRRDVQTISWQKLCVADPLAVFDSAADRDAVVVTDVPGRAQLPASVVGIYPAVPPWPQGDWGIYACRDTVPIDFLEEVDPEQLRSAQYQCASYWHSLIFVSRSKGVAIEDLLPAEIGVKILPLGRYAALDKDIILSDVDDRGEQVALSRPLTLKGVLFLEGWSGLEPWGIWSDGLRAVLRLSFSSSLPLGSTITLDVQGCVSADFPQIAMEIVVNGLSAGRHTIGSANRFTLPIATAHANARVFTVAFLFDEVRSPRDQTGTPDDRRLGLGLKALAVHTSEANGVEQP